MSILCRSVLVHQHPAKHLHLFVPIPVVARTTRNLIHGHMLGSWIQSMVHLPAKCYMGRQTVKLTQYWSLKQVGLITVLFRIKSLIDSLFSNKFQEYRTKSTITKTPNSGKIQIRKLLTKWQNEKFKHDKRIENSCTDLIQAFSNNSCLLIYTLCMNV